MSDYDQKLARWDELTRPSAAPVVRETEPEIRKICSVHREGNLTTILYEEPAVEDEELF